MYSSTWSSAFPDAAISAFSAADEAEALSAPTPSWVQRGIDVLWQHGCGNMQYATFLNLVGLQRMTSVSKKDVFARPEFEWCGKGNNSIRLAGWLRFQRYC